MFSAPGAAGPSSFWGPPVWAGVLTTPEPWGTEEAQSCRNLKSGEHSPSQRRSVWSLPGLLPAEPQRSQAAARPARAGTLPGAHGCPTWTLPRPRFAVGVPPGRSHGRDLESADPQLSLRSPRRNAPGVSALPGPRTGPSETLPPFIPFSSLRGPVGWRTPLMNSPFNLGKQSPECSFSSRSFCRRASSPE